MKTSEHTLSVRLPMEAFGDLQSRADTNCTSLSAVARDLILEGLASGDGEHEFLLRYEWANAVKGRDGHRCVECGSVAGVAAHHIRPVDQHGRNALSNGKTLCGLCHAKAHSTDAHLVETENVRTSLPKAWRQKEATAYAAREMAPADFWREQLALLMTQRRSRRSRIVCEYVENFLQGIPTEVVIRTVLSLATTPDVLRKIPARAHSPRKETFRPPPLVWK